MRIRPSSLSKAATSSTPYSLMAPQRTSAEVSIIFSRSSVAPNPSISTSALATTRRTPSRTPSRCCRALSKKESSSTLECRRLVLPLCAGPTRSRQRSLPSKSRSVRGRIRKRQKTVSGWYWTYGTSVDVRLQSSRLVLNSVSLCWHIRGSLDDRMIAYAVLNSRL